MNTEEKLAFSKQFYLKKSLLVSQIIISHLIALNLKKNIFMSLHLQEGWILSKRTIGYFDSFLRNSFSKIFKYGRGRKLINRTR